MWQTEMQSLICHTTGSEELVAEGYGAGITCYFNKKENLHVVGRLEPTEGTAGGLAVDCGGCGTACGGCGDWLWRAPGLAVEGSGTDCGGCGTECGGCGD